MIILSLSLLFIYSVVVGAVILATRKHNQFYPYDRFDGYALLFVPVLNALILLAMLFWIICHVLETKLKLGDLWAKITNFVDGD